MRSHVQPVCAVLLIYLFTASSSWATSPVEFQKLFPEEAELQIEGSGLARLVLPTDVLAQCRPDLSDLRIFDAQGREVAFMVDGDRPPEQVVESGERYAAKVIGVEREEAVPERGSSHTLERYELEAPSHEPEQGNWELVIDSAHKRFVRNVRVSSSASEGDSKTFLIEAPLFRLDGTGENVRVPLPTVAGMHIRVEVEGDEGFYLEPGFYFESRRQFEARARTRVELMELGIERRGGTSLIELQRPSGIVPDLLEVASSTGTFTRKLSVWDHQPGSADHQLGQGTIFRVDTRNGVEGLEVTVQPARGATLGIVIDDGDSPPLSDLRFFAVVRQPALLFELPAAEDGSARGTLRFGGGRAHQPQYDLTALLLHRQQVLTGEPARATARLYDPNQLAIATLGPTRKNPEFDPSPALAFAMHPGAQIDTRVFSHRKSMEIAPSEEGLSRIVLTPEDTARSVANFADLRIVDESSRQWPYLLKRDAEQVEVSLVVEGPTTRKRVSTYRLSPPVSPIRFGDIVLDTAVPFYDRSYTLLETNEKGEKRILSRGRLVKDAQRPRPVRIALAPRPVHEFELQVEDGDDAPLQFDSVYASALVPAIFLAAPAGGYDLLLGNPNSKEPSYEMERVRDVVLAVSSNPATVGVLEENPAFSMRARFQAGDSSSELLQQGLVWGALLLAIFVLGGITLKILRSEH